MVESVAVLQRLAGEDEITPFPAAELLEVWNSLCSMKLGRTSAAVKKNIKLVD